MAFTSWKRGLGHAAYVAYLEAKFGTLLGGVRYTESHPFSTRRKALRWLKQAVWTNLQAGRAVGEHGVRITRTRRKPI